MAGTIIKTCNCKHEFQDSKYGSGKRIMNETTSGYRCTVCGTNVSNSGTITKSKKK